MPQLTNMQTNYLIPEGERKVNLKKRHLSRIRGAHTIRKVTSSVFFLYFACLLPSIAFGLHDHMFHDPAQSCLMPKESQLPKLHEFKEWVAALPHLRFGRARLSNSAVTDHWGPVFRLHGRPTFDSTSNNSTACSLRKITKQSAVQNTVRRTMSIDLTIVNLTVGFFDHCATDARQNQEILETINMNRTDEERNKMKDMKIELEMRESETPTNKLKAPELCFLPCNEQFPQAVSSSIWKHVAPGSRENNRHRSTEEIFSMFVSIAFLVEAYRGAAKEFRAHYIDCIPSSQCLRPNDLAMAKSANQYSMLNNHSLDPTAFSSPSYNHTSAALLLSPLGMMFNDSGNGSAAAANATAVNKAVCKPEAISNRDKERADSRLRVAFCSPRNVFRRILPFQKGRK
ncbi:hypothetical protein ACTXT7_010468 [Hymenolepis weldensis]